MIDLTTKYLGLAFKNPLVASASPLSKKAATAKKLGDAGIGGIVMYSLFEEEIIHEGLALDHFLNQGTDVSQEAQTSFPDFEHYNTGPEGYLKQIEKLKKDLSIPVIASLNGTTTGGWVKYAKMIEDAGADALELNFYHVPTSLSTGAAELEQRFLQLIGDVRQEVRIPLAVKLSASFSSLPNFVSQAVKKGADGMVLFNRFIQPDFDLENMEIIPHLELSTSEELRLPLRWVAILSGRVDADLALTGGVHTGQDMAKAILAGSNVVMSASELIEKGPARAAGLLDELTQWMGEHEYDSVSQMRGAMSQKSVADPTAFERGNYMKALQSFDTKVY
jgi:dihydroorotate dehydrogenase (fumarate)